MGTKTDRQESPQRILIVVRMAEALRDVLEGISGYVRLAGKNWIVRCVDADEWLAMLKPSIADGAITVITARTPALLEKVKRTGVPLVNLFYNVAPRLPSALSDDEAIGATAAADLIGRGYRSFGFVGVNTTWSRDRYNGFTAALSRAGHSCFICPTATKVDDFHFMETRRAGKMIERWLTGLPRPVAILACADLVARTVLGACDNIGIGVPHEAAILGVDNRIAICELARVPLSSVMQDFKRLGFEAARLLDQTMRRRPRAGQAILVPPGAVVTRRSTEALAFEDPHISTAMRLIHQQVATGVSIKELLQHIPVSRKWLDLQFKAVIGRTPSQEIRKLRLAAIRDMLINTDLGIRQIAQRCGFSNAENMIRFFRDGEGAPPQQFRKRQRSQSRL